MVVDLNACMYNEAGRVGYTSMDIGEKHKHLIRLTVPQVVLIMLSELCYTTAGVFANRLQW